MDHFAGLDVSVKQTSICIVDDTGRIVREAITAAVFTQVNPLPEGEAVLLILQPG